MIAGRRRASAAQSSGGGQSSGRWAWGAPALAVLLLWPGAAGAENLLRNASFEQAARGVMLSGYNRYNMLRQPPELRLVERGVERREPREAVLDELEGPPRGAGEEQGWRLVRMKGGGANGDTFLACDIQETLGFGVEVEAGTYTFSVHARGAKDDVIKLRVQDIRGQKGEIRNDYERAFNLTEKWTRCAVTTSVHAGPVTCYIETLGKGRVEADAIQLEAGDKATPFQLHPWDRTPPAEIAEKEKPLHPPTVQRVPVEYVSGVLSGIAPVPDEVRAGPSQEGELPLRVAVPPGVKAFPLPCSGGVPLPRGHLFDERQAVIVDAEGREVPCQTRVLSRHVRDGSIQMLLVDLAAPAADARYSLRYGPALLRAESPSPLAVKEEGGTIEVNTGPLRFRLRKDAFNLFDALWFDADGDGAFSAAEQVIAPGVEQGPWMQDPAGRMYWSALGRTEAVRVEEAGPVRACVAASGTHRDAAGREMFRYVARVHAFAGKPWARIEHVFSNEQQPYSTVMTGAGVRLALKPGLFGGLRADERTACSVAAGETAFVVEGLGLRHWSGDKTRTFRATGNGTVVLTGPSLSLTASIREWEWMPPKEFCFEGSGALDLCVWPRHLTSGLAVPRGMARSHRLWLRFDRAAPGAEERAAWNGFVRGDCLVEADPSAYCDSAAFGRLAALDEENFPRYERFLRPEGEGTFGRFPRPGEYRWRDFVTYGDDRGDGGWGNMETMLDHCMWLLYIRSLDPWYYRRAADASVHYRDVDLCHPWGQERVHCHNHTVVPWDCSHAWIKGVLDHYLLTGDGRSLEVAHEHGRWLRSLPADYKIKEGSRRFTRVIQNLADLYRLTGHREYLADFTARMDKAEELRGPYAQVSRFDLGKVYGRKDPAAAPEPSYGRIGFMQYYGIYGLMSMAEATEDARWKRAFLEEAAFLVADAEKGAPCATEEEFIAWGRARGLSVNSGRDRMCYPPLGYAYELTGEEKWKQALVHAAFAETTRPMKPESWPSLGYADQVLTAHGVYWAQRDGQSAEHESALREGTKGSLRDTLRDADFDSPRVNAWVSGGEVLTLARMRGIYIVKDPAVKRGGDHSLLVDTPGLTAATKELDRSYRKRPLPLDRNYVVLKEPGAYELTGFVKFWKHDRPDAALWLSGLSSEDRRELPLGLYDALPKPRYEGILGLHTAGPQLTEDGRPLAEGEKEARPVLDELEGRKAAPEENPDDYWWRFAFAFEVKEPTRVGVVLLDRFGLFGPGKVWFDEFAVRRLPGPPDTLNTARVTRDARMSVPADHSGKALSAGR